MMPLVSIIVPTFNAARFLPELCASLQAQTVGDFEVLILDDGSSDNTTEVISRFTSDKRFRFERWAENRGVGEATRKLFSQVRGQFWCNPGADDVFKPNFIERRLALARKSDKPVMIHGPPVLIDEHSKPLPPTPDPFEIPEFLPQERALKVLLEHNIINTPSVFMPTVVTQTVLPHFVGNWKFAQDWFLWILHIGAGCDLVRDSVPLHFYRIHPASLTWRPDWELVRETEIRLVPVCALSRAAQLTPTAAQMWKQWKRPLYAMWLRRAFKWRAHMNNLWLSAAATAYYGREVRRVSLPVELARHAATLVRITRAERDARRANCFEVSGCAAIGDEIFRGAPTRPGPETRGQ